jgi:hypothetical protein
MGYSIYPAPSAATKWQQTAFITSTGTWTVPADVSTVDIMLVGGGGGGGGGGGSNNAGGGAGGGVLIRSVSVTPATGYTVTIGGGGTGGTSGPTQGSDGSASTFGSLATSYGGGGGGVSNTGAWTGSFTTPVAATGGNGGAGGYGGGGGGAGMISLPGFSTNFAMGVMANNRVVQGSAGYQNSFVTGSPAGNVGLNGYGAGGGGGTGDTSMVPFGGLNAGQGGVTSTAPTSATANFGGGGGGRGSVAGAGANGGSGVCIIKYWSAL